ncbi:MAG: hypothetical protein AAFO82_07720 [Bacteroidota bacterium]
MKAKILLSFIVLTLAVACSPILLTGDQASNTILNYKMKETFRFWNSNQAPNDYAFYESNHTYIEQGLRYNYAILKNIASISILERIMGEKIFITGPHEEGLNYFSDNSFGYYNPAFWEQVETVMEYSLENDGVFKQLGKYVYDQHLKKEAQLYYDSYQFLKDNASMVEKVSKEYQAAMKDDRMAGVVLQDSFRAFADSKEELGEDWYVANTAPGFWVRRQLDGTAEQIFEILELVRNAYETPRK